VYSPAPSHFGKERGAWLSWTAKSELKWRGDGPAFNLPDNAAKIQARLGWLYWVDEQYAAFGEPADDRINEIAENLDLLLKNNIYEGDHLLKLASVVDGPLLETRPEAMAILQSREESFIKVEQLMQTASANPQ
jgi:hypothetical protein